MNPTVLCADPQHPLVLEIAQRLGMRPRLPEVQFTTEDGPVLLVQTVNAQPWRCDVGERPLLVIAPWHLRLSDPLPGTALLRHGSLISDLRHHDEAINQQRLLLWPYADERMAWLADKDLVDAVEDWLNRRVSATSTAAIDRK